MSERHAQPAGGSDRATEANAVALRWLADRRDELGLRLDGHAIAGDDLASHVVMDPSTGHPLVPVNMANADIGDRALSTARRAAARWMALSVAERAGRLRAMADGLKHIAGELATLHARQHGVPARTVQHVDIPKAVAALELAAVAVLEPVPESDDGGGTAGVEVFVAPANAPLNIAWGAVAGALVAGCGLVIVQEGPASLATLYALERIEDSAVPGGSIGVIGLDGGGLASWLATIDPDRITVVGSAARTRDVRVQLAGRETMCTWRVLRRTPIIVGGHGDLDAAVEAAMDTLRRDPGDDRCGGADLLVEERVAEAVRHRLEDRLQRVVVGDPLRPDCDIGPISDRVRWERLTDLIRDARDGSLVDVWQPDLAIPDEGWFVPPTVFDEPSAPTRARLLPLAGPILTWATYRTMEEAVAMATDGANGGCASVWTQDIEVALHVGRRLRRDDVWINASPDAPAAIGIGGPWAPAYARAERTSAAALAEDDARFRPGGLDRAHVASDGRRQDGTSTSPVALPKATDAAIQRAVDRAKGADWWPRCAPVERADRLRRLSELVVGRLVERRGDGASGNRPVDGLTEIALPADDAAEAATYWHRWAARALRPTGWLEEPGTGVMVWKVREPHGVVVLECPALSLAALAALTGPLLSSGNRVVVVPEVSGDADLSALRLLLQRDGLHDGVLTILSDGGADVLPTVAVVEGVDAVWCLAGTRWSAAVERRVVQRDGVVWRIPRTGDGAGVFGRSGEASCWRHAARVKSLWIPRGA